MLILQNCLQGLESTTLLYTSVSSCAFYSSYETHFLVCFLCAAFSDPNANPLLLVPPLYFAYGFGWTLAILPQLSICLEVSLTLFQKSTLQTTKKITGHTHVYYEYLAQYTIKISMNSLEIKLNVHK